MIAATLNGIFLSGDNGNTWTKKRSEGTSLTINARGEIFVGSYYTPGVLRSTDHGNTWIAFGLANTAVAALAIDSSGFLYTSPANRAGLFRTKSSTTE